MPKGTIKGTAVMADYDYREGKRRIEEILNTQNDTARADRIPSASAFSFDNGYYGYVTALFVDICGSTELFNDSSLKRNTRAKIIRSFTSEVIEILRGDNNLRDIGIRGDCVFAIYTTPSFENGYEIFDKAVTINTFRKMLNAILEKRGLRTIQFGVGISTGNELVVKAGRKGTNINDLIWIGKAVTYASHYSGLANRNNNDPIIVSKEFYENLKHAIDKNNPYGVKIEWFSPFPDKDYPGMQCDVIKTDMRSWIDKGMSDE